MSITANTLYRDSFNFLRNQLPAILLLALLTAFITVMLNQAFIPDTEQLSSLSSTESDFASSGNLSITELVAQLTPEQQIVLLKVSAAATFSALIGNVLLVGGMLTLISMVSQGRRVSALQAIGISLPILPRLLLLMFIGTLLIQLGITLFIVPGIVIAVALSLSPAIVTTEKIGVFAAMKASTKLAFANVRLIIPAMMLWIAAKLILLYLVNHLTVLPTPIASVVLASLSNLVSALLLVYLFRLYMLLRPTDVAV
ncbi:YciC family protein [Yersinia rochesterensis]|uniref:YciC family protein n=1 Tax=Yersinia rochesterensis TaxID=1604335 RepID=UPI0028533F2B|nr:YciC family protein [Yersinia rochesterensis]MDR5020184.1 YciC family protein [Yersinia rochesterensis]